MYTKENSMFTPVFFIEMFQGAKRSLTNKIITDEVLNRAANDFITAQTEFAKMLANNAITMAKYSMDNCLKKQ